MIKRIISIFLLNCMLLAMLVLPSCSSGLRAEDVTVGMSFEEYAETVSAQQRVDYKDLSFFQTKDGETVLVRFDSEERGAVSAVIPVSSSYADGCTWRKAHELLFCNDLNEVIGVMGCPDFVKDDVLWFLTKEGTQVGFKRYDIGDHSQISSFRALSPAGDEELSRLKRGMTASEINAIMNCYGVDTAGVREPISRQWDLADGRFLDVYFSLDKTTGEYCATSACVRNKSEKTVLFG